MAHMNWPDLGAVIQHASGPQSLLEADAGIAASFGLSRRMHAVPPINQKHPLGRIQPICFYPSSAEPGALACCPRYEQPVWLKGSNPCRSPVLGEYIHVLAFFFVVEQQLASAESSFHLITRGRPLTR
jgi:hypothetical protein